MAENSSDSSLWIIPFIGIIILVMLVIVPLGTSYNDLVSKDMSVEYTKATVQTALERRADLIPNLVATIEGSAEFEKGTLVEVTAMRNQAMQIKETLQSEQTVDELQKSQEELGVIIGRLMVVYEQYPTLQTTQSFRELQAQLVATENQINGERNNYNAAVMNYKSTVRSFPTVIIARLFGFEEDAWTMFEAYPGKANVPVVQFNTCG
jgi:LemA protein